MTKDCALNITVRAIKLARRSATAGRTALALRAWTLACRTAFRCGGLSGCGMGGHAILIQRGGRDYVAYLPVMPERAENRIGA